MVMKVYGYMAQVKARLVPKCWEPQQNYVQLFEVNKSSTTNNTRCTFQNTEFQADLRPFRLTHTIATCIITTSFVLCNQCLPTVPSKFEVFLLIFAEYHRFRQELETGSTGS